MKCKIVFLMAVFVWWMTTCLVVPAAVAKETETFPKAVVAPASAIFSPTIDGSEVIHTFEIQNAGPAILRILGVYTE
ncbi:MAG: hypothetical protein ABIK15_19015 [Pseudomonadota bacterium]